MTCVMFEKRSNIDSESTEQKTDVSRFKTSMNGVCTLMGFINNTAYMTRERQFMINSYAQITTRAHNRQHNPPSVA